MAEGDKRKGCAERRGEGTAVEAPRGFSGLWTPGVLAVGAVGYAVRWWLHP